MTKNEIIEYWSNSSDVDYRAMESLFDNGHYAWALFIGHLVIEKLLKAYYIKNVGSDFPQIHHLLKIAEKSKLELTEDQKNFLLEVTAFNIKARYLDYKYKFYKKATKTFTEKYINKIRKFRQWLIKKISS